MLNDLIFVCKVVGLIALILLGVVIIIGIIQGFIDNLETRKFNKDFRERLYRAMEQAEEDIKKEKAKPKKPNARKKTTKKDSE